MSRPVDCNYCGKRLADTTELLAHLREHDPALTYVPRIPVLGESSKPFRQADEAALQVARQHETQVRFKW